MFENTLICQSHYIYKENINFLLIYNNEALIFFLKRLCPRKWEGFTSTCELLRYEKSS